MTEQEKIFIESCCENNLTSIITCIKYNVDIHVENDWCIDIVSRKGYSKLVKFFLENGISHESACQKNALAYACDYQDLELVKYLTKHSAHKKDKAALPWAAHKENIEIVELLLGYLDDFSHVFCSAAEGGQIHILNLLIDNDIQKLDHSAERAPYWAAEKNNWEAVQLLIDNNIGTLKNLGDKYSERFLSWQKDKC